MGLDIGSKPIEKYLSVLDEAKTVLGMDQWEFLKMKFILMEQKHC